ncbi:MAG: hypothetical protein ABI548_18120 [Polyangiaceae bacterium]
MANFRNANSFTWALALGSALLSGACGSKTTSGTSGTSGSPGTAGETSSTGDSAGDSGNSAAPTACAKNAINILFSPMYSAFDGMHTFQIPAVVNGLDASQISINWSASDPSMVKIETDPTTGGAMITTQKAGKVTIIATAGSLCGSSLLTITAATPQDWTDGSMRYNDGVVINRIPRAGGGMPPGAGGSGGGGGTDASKAACTNCHGDTASGPYKTVQHTPEQTGGFSDADLIGIFQNGTVPTGGYFDATIVAYPAWQSFHKWDVGDTPQNMVVFLRSLTPAAQTGTANFGGAFMGNGGAGGRGGFGRGGAGGGMGRGGAGGGAGMANGAGSAGMSAAGMSSGGTSGGTGGGGTSGGGTGGDATSGGGTSGGGA